MILTLWLAVITEMLRTSCGWFVDLCANEVLLALSQLWPASIASVRKSESVVFSVDFCTNSNIIVTYSDSAACRTGRFAFCQSVGVIYKLDDVLGALGKGQLMGKITSPLRLSASNDLRQNTSAFLISVAVVAILKLSGFKKERWRLNTSETRLSCSELCESRKPSAFLTSHAHIFPLPDCLIS